MGNALDRWFRRVPADGESPKLSFGRRWMTMAAATAIGLGLLGTKRPARAFTGSREISDMTWLEVRDALQMGLRTAIVPTGGLEQNGPHMIIGKHDYIVRWAARRIAAELGDALVAPVVSYVPQGAYSPPTQNMQWPGTIGIPPAAFAGVLEGIARSLNSAGFDTICFISDHGMSQRPQADVAARLNREWEGHPRVIAVDSYYADAAETSYLRAQGETDSAIGQHATIADTSELMAVHPAGVDLSRLSSTRGGLGAVGDPTRSTAARGDALMAMKVRMAVDQIAIATGHRRG